MIHTFNASNYLYRELSVLSYMYMHMHTQLNLFNDD